MGVRAGLPDGQLSTSHFSKFNQSIAIWIAFDSGKDFSEEIASAMRLLEAVGLGLLLMVSFVLTAPAPEPQNGRQTAGLVTLNTMTLMPLLLAGAAFAKGYLIGNLKHRKVSSGHGGYGPPLGYNRLGYGYPSYHQGSYHQDPYPHRRVDDAVAEQAAVFDELLVVDLAIAVDVRLAEHLIDLLIGELLTKVGHDVAQLSGRDEAVAVLVEHAEGLLELLLGVGVLHLA